MRRRGAVSFVDLPVSAFGQPIAVSAARLDREAACEQDGKQAEADAFVPYLFLTFWGVSEIVGRALDALCTSRSTPRAERRSSSQGF